MTVPMIILALAIIVGYSLAMVMLVWLLYSWSRDMGVQHG